MTPTPSEPRSRPTPVALPYHGKDGQIRWGWNVCPDCGKVGAHPHTPNPLGLGIRCG